MTADSTKSKSSSTSETVFMLSLLFGMMLVQAFVAPIGGTGSS